jgi:hypothetical protein
MSDETLALWTAVGRLTESTRQKMPRDEQGTWLDELADQRDGVCSIPAYRSAKSGWATIPSLWDQSTIALNGGETQIGQGSKPLRERSVADLHLLELRADIRETVRDALETLAADFTTAAARNRPFTITELRTLASTVAAKQPDRLAWWTYLVTSWCNRLTAYLNTAEHEARPIYLRNSRCPLCRVGQVILDKDADGERKIVPAIVIDFRDGHVRAATCQACTATWFRGGDLEKLADDLGVGLPADTPTTEAAC